MGDYGCRCKEGYEMFKSHCHATGPAPIVLYTNGPDIRMLDLKNEIQGPVITGESRVQALDYDPREHMLYWTDSYEKTIKRAFLPNLTDVSAGIGFPQNLELKGLTKPNAIAVDWVGRTIYWMDTDLSSTRPKGRIFVSLIDGRYRKTLLSSNLERPTSMAVDPDMGWMFWSDSGSNPKIETAWMDGSKRRIIVGDKIGYPTGLTIDYAADHRVFWCDSKLNTIETAKQDGSDRVVLVSGDIMHPFAMDLFEDSLFWVTRDSGEIYRQDKHGRGVKVRVKRNVENPTGVKIFQPLKYNLTVPNRCPSSGCSHLCLLVPQGYRCACPDGTSLHVLNFGSCDAGFEVPKPQPYKCPCRNGGHCESVRDEQIVCRCPSEFEGMHCENFIARRRISSLGGASGVAAVLVPIIVVLIIMIVAATLFVCVRRRHFKQSGLGGSTQSVSFRSGTNVEFSPNFMRTRQAETNAESLDADFGLNDVNKATDFSNPMYDAIGNADSTAGAGETGKGGLYEVAGDVFDKKYDKNSGTNKAPPSVGSAVLHPSMVLHRSSPHVPLRQTALDPTTVDTDKDTQNLVEEDKSEC